MYKLNWTAYALFSPEFNDNANDQWR